MWHTNNTLVATACQQHIMCLRHTNNTLVAKACQQSICGYIFIKLCAIGLVRSSDKVFIAVNLLNKKYINV